MKVRFVTACCAIIFLASSVSLPQEVISVEEAMEAIREFEGISDLKLKYLGLDRRYGAGLWLWPVYCILSVDERLPRVGFSVCPYSGEIRGRTDAKVNLYEPRDGRIGDMLSVHRLYEIACKFIKKRIPSFNPKHYRVYVYEAEPHWYSQASKYRKFFSDVTFDFYFPKERISWLETGISTYRKEVFKISLHSITGRVGELDHYRYTTNRLFHPKIDERKAKEIAVAYMKALGAAYRAKYANKNLRRFHKPIECAYAYKAYARYEETVDYPNVLVPVWAIVVLYATKRPDPERNPYCCSFAHMVEIHAETGEVISDTWVDLGDDMESIKVDEAYMRWYDRLPIMPLPWKVKMEGQLVGAVYPFPIEHGGKLYVKRTIAWLAGVKVKRVLGGALLTGVDGEERVLVKESDLLMQGEEVWVPIDKVAKASRAKLQVDSEQRIIFMKPFFPIHDKK